MTTPDKILVDLIAGQATTDALAERMRIPMLAVRAMCERHEIDGLLEWTKIADTLVVWRLTYPGRVVAAELEASGAGNKRGTANIAR
jgi:hypothetical protein